MKKAIVLTAILVLGGFGCNTGDEQESPPPVNNPPTIDSSMPEDATSNMEDMAKTIEDMKEQMQDMKMGQMVSGGAVPPGSVVAFVGPKTKVPEGWLIADGRALDPTDDRFENLFNTIGTANGGDGVTEFRLPDLRGRFLRGVDSGAGVDPDASSRRRPTANSGNSGDQVGSVQDDQFLSHQHGPTGQRWGVVDRDSLGGNGGLDANDGGSTYGTGLLQDVLQARGGSETRPKNIYVHFIIKL